jgi:hypothetical protein
MCDHSNIKLNPDGVITCNLCSVELGSGLVTFGVTNVAVPEPIHEGEYECPRCGGWNKLPNTNGERDGQSLEAISRGTHDRNSPSAGDHRPIKAGEGVAVAGNQRAHQRAEQGIRPLEEAGGAATERSSGEPVAAPAIEEDAAEFYERQREELLMDPPLPEPIAAPHTNGERDGDLDISRDVPMAGVSPGEAARGDKVAAPAITEGDGRVCPGCDGSGFIWSRRCSQCEGKGTVPSWWYPDHEQISDSDDDAITMAIISRLKQARRTPIAAGEEVHEISIKDHATPIAAGEETCPKCGQHASMHSTADPCYGAWDLPPIAADEEDDRPGLGSSATPDRTAFPPIAAGEDDE